MVLSPAAESELLAQHTPLVIHLASRYVNHGVPRDDLIQDGLMAMVEAIRSFDSSKPMKLNSWIALLSSQAMFHAVRAAGRNGPTQQLGDQAELIIDDVGDQADDGDVWDALQVVREDLGRHEAGLFWAWLGFGSQSPLTLTNLCNRYRVDMPHVLAIIGLGLRSCHDRLGITRESSCLNRSPSAN